MEFFGPSFKEDFPFFPTIFLENNPKQDPLNLMGNSNALMQNYNAIGYEHKHGHGHVHGHDDGHLADDDHHHRHGVFPTDLNYDPAPADDYHHNHQHHDRRHHHGHQNNGDEPMVPFDHVLTFHDLNMMPEEEGAAADPVADVDEKGKEKVKKNKRKVVEAQPVEESAQEPYHAHTKTPMVKGQWSPQEDMRLVQLVNHYGVKKWSHIAQKLGGRVGKQCRERWNNHLRSNIKKGEWSLEEDMILIEAHKELGGTKWCQIAKHLPGRTENTIKNHWNATLRKRFPRDESYGEGSNLLRNYIRSVTSSSSLAKNNADNKRKYTRRNEKLPYDGKQVAADSNRLERNLNLELPLGNEHGVQLVGPCGCGRSYLLFGHDQTDNAGTSKENVEAARKEMDLIEMISHRRA